MNNAALGFTLLIGGLVLFASALNKTTAAMLTGLIYGEGALKTPTANPITTQMNSPINSQTMKQSSDGGPTAGVVPTNKNGTIPGLTAPILTPAQRG